MKSGCKKSGKEKIGAYEFFAVELVMALGGALWSGGIERCLGGMAWLAALFVGLTVFVVLWIFSRFWRIFARKSWGEGWGYACGRAGGRLILFGYVVFGVCLVARELARGMALWGALRAPEVAPVMCSGLLAVTAAVYVVAGAVTLGRMALVIVVPTLLLLLANLLLTVSGGDVRNLLPLAMPVAMPSGEALVLLLLGGGNLLGDMGVVLPYLVYLDESAKILSVSRAVGIVAAAIWGTVVVVTQVVLGASLPLYDFPVLQVFRLAEVGHWFSRFEVIGVLLLESLLLLRTALMLGAAVISARWLWRDYWKKIGKISVFCVVAMLSSVSLIVRGKVWEYGLGVAGMIFGVLMPVACIVGTAIRKRRENRTVVVNK